MSALVRLYPAAWRERYEEEFISLLEVRPPTLGERFDIVRGAVDARIHPQVRRSPQDPITDDRAPGPAIARLLGVGAILGGAIWVAAWFIAISGPLIGEASGAYHDGAAAIPFFLLAMGMLVGGLVGELILLPGTARLARIGAIVAIPGLLVWTFVPWSLPEFVVAVAALLTMSVGAVWAKAWSILTGSLVIGALVVLLLAVIPAFSGLVEFPPELGMMAMAVFGSLIWLGIGGSLVTGAAPTRIRPA